MNRGRQDEAFKLMDDVNKKLKKRFSGQEELDLSIDLARCSFSVNPTSQLKYEKLLDEQKETFEKIVGKY